MKIYGAGIAGLLAGSTFQHAEIYEAKDESQIGHRALLRFRSSAVGDAVGIEFRKVKVQKNIWSNRQAYTKPTILQANNYSRKVVSRLASRSIWDLRTVERYIAPDDFIPQLIERCRSRIHWNHAVERSELLEGKEHAISTMPMSVMERLLLKDSDPPVFSAAPIIVQRYRIPDADVYQTIYFPDLDTNVYRVSITGDVMIAEYVEGVDDFDVFEPFGLLKRETELLGRVEQSYGKIVPIDEVWRKRFIFNLTHDHNIYSLGRFATWRNILLDDVLHDLDVLKRLMKSSSYEHFRATTK